MELDFNPLKLPVRGWGPWKQEFYSIHSSPSAIKADVNHENGIWHYVWLVRMSSFVYKKWPNFWRWYVNLSFFHNRRTKQLQKFFPNIR